MPWPLKIPHIVLTVVVCAAWGICVCHGEKNGFRTVDVAKLASLKQGTELVLIEKAYHDEQSYRLEDFFWTGSGDGAIGEDENQWGSEAPSTIYKTKTVLSTVYIETPSTRPNQSTISTTPKCILDCDYPTIPDGEINPTPTINPGDWVNSTDETLDADHQFWLLTVLKSDGKDPVILDLKNSLAKLYRTAFRRQQDRHLGINGRTKRNPVDEKPVNVYIHKIAKSPINGDEKIEVLYHVAVSGKPVDAETAAADMRLVSDDEVIQELGYPFLVKAEPYMKATEPQGLASPHNTWLFIGSSMAVLFLLLLLVAFLSLCINKRKKSNQGLENRHQVFTEQSGSDNLAYTGEQGKDQKAGQSKGKRLSPTYINFKTEPSNQTLRSGIIISRPESSLSTSSTSSSSIDISPLMGLNKQQRSAYHNPIRPKAAINKTAPLGVFRKHQRKLIDSDSSTLSSRRDSPETIIVGNYDPGVVSPKSYLSMPSVKSFPRGNIPEPLNKVLEPVSVLHLDLADDLLPDEVDFHKGHHKSCLKRHGSMGTEEDPGVIGPVVWSMHKQRLQHGTSFDEGLEDVKIGSNVARMRKRFHDLLDDTFSLFGSRKDISSDDTKHPPIEIKSHSAINNRPPDEVQVTLKQRPKTSDPRRVLPSPGSDPPRGAWTSTAPSPLVRPLSAGPLQRATFTPRVDVDHILAEGKLQPNDPAIPLIAAIKTEIEKCSLPGSTTNLAE